MEEAITIKFIVCYKKTDISRSYLLYVFSVAIAMWHLVLSVCRNHNKRQSAFFIDQLSLSINFLCQTTFFNNQLSSSINFFFVNQLYSSLAYHYFKDFLSCYWMYSFEDNLNWIQLELEFNPELFRINITDITLDSC